MLDLDVICRLRSNAKGSETPVNKPFPQALTTSFIVDHLVGFPHQYFSMNFHISVVRQSCSPACGLAGLFSWATWMATVSFLTLPRRCSQRDFHRGHCEQKNVGRLGCRCGVCTGFVGRVDNLRGRPSRCSYDPRCCIGCEGRVRDNGTKAVITDQGCPSL